MTIESILQERQKTHGNFKDQSMTAQALKHVISSSPNWDLLTSAQKEALELICTKISRIGHGDPEHRDSWSDIAGYATLIAKDDGN